MSPIEGLSIALHTLLDGTYRVHFPGPAWASGGAAFTPPCHPEERQLIAQVFELTFDIDEAPQGYQPPCGASSATRWHEPASP